MEVGGKLICKDCAQNIANKQVSMAAINRKEPLLSLILSFFIPGLGQLYNGEMTKGIILLVAWVLSIVLFFACIGFLTYLVVWLYAMFDGYTVAEKINKGEIKV